MADFAALSDINPDQYTGLTDTGAFFTGSSTLQDVQLGSPIVLDTSQMTVPDASVVDLLQQVPTETYNLTQAEMSQMLSGASDVPISATSAIASTPTPNSVPSSVFSANALSSLSKFGSGIAALFGGQPRVVSAAPGATRSATGASLNSSAGYNNGSFTAVALIVFGVLILLLLRGE